MVEEKQWKSEGKRKIFMKINKDWATISTESQQCRLSFYGTAFSTLTKCYFIFLLRHGAQKKI